MFMVNGTEIEVKSADEALEMFYKGSAVIKCLIESHSRHCNSSIFLRTHPGIVVWNLIFLDEYLYPYFITCQTPRFLYHYHLGQQRRKVAHTALNAESSRSHSIFTLRLVQAPFDEVSQTLILVWASSLPAQFFLNSLYCYVWTCRAFARAGH